MKIIHRPLLGIVVNVSMSESNDSESRGFPSALVNRVTLQVVSALLGQGAGLIFGHDWREDGVMETVHGLAQQARSIVSRTNNELHENSLPLLQNVLPWPDQPRLSKEDRECLAFTLRVEQAGLPEDLIQYEKRALAVRQGSDLYRYLRSRGLTHLRRRLTELSHARVCIGGRTRGSRGRYPGVIEEALLSLEYGKPLYLVGLLGGATHQLIRAVLGDRMPDDFCSETTVSKIYSTLPKQYPELASGRDGPIPKESLWQCFGEYGIKSLANGLNARENRRLFQAMTLDEAIQMILMGLSRLPTTKG